MYQAPRPTSLFSELFLTRAEKDNIAVWQYKVHCPGIASAILNPFYNRIVKFVPKSVSPNVLSFSGLLMSIFAWQNAVKTTQHTLFDLSLVAFGILMYMILDDIDGKHSRNTLTSSPLGELVDHFCDCITNGLVTTAVCWIFGITDASQLWLMVLFTGAKFALEHLHAFADPHKVLKFGVLTGPTEILVLTIASVFFKDAIFAFVGPQLPTIIFTASMAMFVVTLVRIPPSSLLLPLFFLFPSSFLPSLLHSLLSPFAPFPFMFLPSYPK
jgi:ethanolaminephosphotransferase